MHLSRVSFDSLNPGDFFICRFNFKNQSRPTETMLLVVQEKIEEDMNGGSIPFLKCTIVMGDYPGRQQNITDQDILGYTAEFEAVPSRGLMETMMASGTANQRSRVAMLARGGSVIGATQEEQMAAKIVRARR